MDLKFQNQKLENEIKALLANEAADLKLISDAENSIESFQRDIELNAAIEASV